MADGRPEERLAAEPQRQTRTPVQDFERQRAVIAREEAMARFLDRLTDLADLGHDFLGESVRAKQAEQEERRRRREERERRRQQQS